VGNAKVPTGTGHGRRNARNRREVSMVFWVGLVLGLIVGVWIGNDKLRSVVAGKSKIRVIPNEKEEIKK